MEFRIPEWKRKCVTCQKEFTPHNDRQIYCSRKCWSSYNRPALPHHRRHLIEKPCAYCGKPFTRVHPNDQYCAEHRKGNHPVPSLSKALVEKLCRLCGNPFTTTDNRFEYCSAECSSKASSEKRLQSLLRERKKKRPNPLVTRTCPFCKSKFTTRKVKKKFCDKTCTLKHERLLKRILRNVPPNTRNAELEKLEQQGKDYVFTSE